MWRHSMPFMATSSCGEAEQLPGRGPAVAGARRRAGRNSAPAGCPSRSPRRSGCPSSQGSGRAFPPRRRWRPCATARPPCRSGSPSRCSCGGIDRLGLLHRLADPLLHAVDHAVHHLLAVQQREVLRPAQVPDVGPELVGTLGQVGQVGVGQRDPPAAASSRATLMCRGDPVPHSARARVQEQPDPVGLVQAHLDEVIARAEAAKLQPPVRAIASARSAPAAPPAPRSGPRSGVVDRLVVLAGRQRNRALDRLTQRGRSPRPRTSAAVNWVRTRDHPAADVHADRRRDDPRASV